MTTEDDFHAALDANPDDWQTRLVFGDWLQERGDPRADGYRALGALRLHPCMLHVAGECPYWVKRFPHGVYRPNNLPDDWFGLLDVKGKKDECAPRWDEDTSATRCSLEDAAALAFARLPADRRVELLKSG